MVCSGAATICRTGNAKLDTVELVQENGCVHKPRGIDLIITIKSCSDS